MAMTMKDAITVGNLIREAAESEIQIALQLGLDTGQSRGERIVGIRGAAYKSVRDLYYILPDKVRSQFNYTEQAYLNAISMGRDWNPQYVKRETPAEALARVDSQTKADQAYRPFGSWGLSKIGGKD